MSFNIRLMCLFVKEEINKLRPPPLVYSIKHGFVKAKNGGGDKTSFSFF